MKDPDLADRLRERGRALTPEEKRAIVERLLIAWLSRPEERLGQFIIDCVALGPREKSDWTMESYAHKIFDIEDRALAELCESRVRR